MRGFKLSLSFSKTKTKPHDTRLTRDYDDRDDREIMASNFNYIERPDEQKNKKCRVCSKAYTSGTSFNLFRQKKDGSLSLSERFRAENFIVEKDPDKSDSICRPCLNKLKTLEEAKQIKQNWAGIKRKASEEGEGEGDVVIGGKEKKARIEENEKVSNIFWVFCQVYYSKFRSSSYVLQRRAANNIP